MNLQIVRKKRAVLQPRSTINRQEANRSWHSEKTSCTYLVRPSPQLLIVSFLFIARARFINLGRSPPAPSINFAVFPSHQTFHFFARKFADCFVFLGAIQLGVRLVKLYIFHTFHKCFSSYRKSTRLNF